MNTLLNRYMLLPLSQSSWYFTFNIGPLSNKSTKLVRSNLSKVYSKETIATKSSMEMTTEAILKVSLWEVSVDHL